MVYSLEFLPSAVKEWRSLGGNVREQFKKKLQLPLQLPHVPSAKLSGMPDCCKIKLRAAGYRLGYRVGDAVVTVVVVALSGDGTGTWSTRSPQGGRNGLGGR